MALRVVAVGFGERIPSLNEAHLDVSEMDEVEKILTIDQKPGELIVALVEDRESGRRLAELAKETGMKNLSIIVGAEDSLTNSMRAWSGGALGVITSGMSDLEVLDSIKNLYASWQIAQTP